MARQLERVGNHASNITEDAVYLVGAEKIATFPQITTIMEPTTGFEPVTYGLRNRCSTS